MIVRRLTLKQKRVLVDALRRASSETRATAVQAATPTSKLGVNDNHVRELLGLAKDQDDLAAEIDRVANIILETK